MPDPVIPAEGMTISVRLRRDLVITDPERFLAAARAAYQELDPGCSDTEAAEAVADVNDAVFALLEHTWRPSTGSPSLWPDWGRPETSPGGPLPGVRVTDRPDGLSPAGWQLHVTLTEPQPLQDYGCFAPPDPFALPPDR